MVGEIEKRMGLLHPFQVMQHVRYRDIKPGQLRHGRRSRRSRQIRTICLGRRRRTPPLWRRCPRGPFCLPVRLSRPFRRLGASYNFPTSYDLSTLADAATFSTYTAANIPPTFFFALDTFLSLISQFGLVSTLPSLPAFSTFPPIL